MAPKVRAIPELQVKSSVAYEKMLRSIKKKVSLNDEKMIDTYLDSIVNTNTKISHTLAIAYHFRKTKNKLNEKYRKRAVSLRGEQSESKDQQVLPNRQFISWEEIVNLREKYKNASTYKEHLKYLMLCLYTYIPPLRGEWSNISIEEKKEPNDGDNYLFIDREGDLQYIIQNDKVSKSHRKLRANVEEPLKSILKASFRKFVRSYVLTSSIRKTEPLSYQTFYDMLKSVDARLSVDTMRSAFATHFVGKYNNDEKTIENIAKLMRTSPEILRKEYLKKNEVEPLGEEQKVEESEGEEQALEPEEEKKGIDFDSMTKKQIEAFAKNNGVNYKIYKKKREEVVRYLRDNNIGVVEEKEEKKGGEEKKQSTRSDYLHQYYLNNKAKKYDQFKVANEIYMANPINKQIKRISNLVARYNRGVNSPSRKNIDALGLVFENEKWKSSKLEELRIQRENERE